MWWKNEGFILAELLLSLAVLLMLSLFFIPLFIDLTVQTRNLHTEKQAYLLMYDELQTLIVNPQMPQNHSILIKGIEYQITFKDTVVPGQKEVCVKVEKNGLTKETNICKVSE